MNSPHLLSLADADLYAAFRREMLLSSPWAFCSSPEDDRFRDVAALRAGLASGDTNILVLQQPESRQILAAAGVVREPKIKRSHIAMIVGVYVTPEARGRGLGSQVVSAAIDIAKSWSRPSITAIELSVSENAPEAKRLYESLGFVQWGVEPDALRVGGKSYAEIHMQLRVSTSESGSI